MLNDIEQRALNGVISNANAGILLSAGILRDLECVELIEELSEISLSKMMFDRTPLPKYLYDLISFIGRYRVDKTSTSKLMAVLISIACFGSRHLWEDIGLTGRSEVTCLLESYFPDLAKRNLQNYKWKKFLFIELGNSMGIEDLRPPKCTGCDQFKICFP